MKRFNYILPALFLALTSTLFVSCDDMLDMGNDDVLYADENHLTQATDTVNSFVGILAQLQKIAVRTNLYGELRGDLTVVNTTANADLKEIANFQVGDDNAYNNPRDYYAVINNCNYYITNANIWLKESTVRNGTKTDFYVFRSEYVAVRAIRAWVYLQLGQIYGENIPLVTTPILSLEEADNALTTAPRVSLAQLCDFFIDDLTPYVAWFSYPYHGNPGYFGYNDWMPSRMAVLPISLVLGDFYLWRASLNQNPADAREAAKCYYDYINWIPTDAGVDNYTAYKRKNATGTMSSSWSRTYFTSGSFIQPQSDTEEWFNTHSFGYNSDAKQPAEVIAAIPMDSADSEGYFNELRYLYCYSENKEASLAPSEVCYQYSDNSPYFSKYDSRDQDTATVTDAMLTEEQIEKHQIGDLRLPTVLSYVQRNNNDYLSQMIFKHYKGRYSGTDYKAQDVIIYRTGDVYLRMAEALNYAGFPTFALAILTKGLDSRVISHDVLSVCNNSTDSAFVSYFDFPRSASQYMARVDQLGEPDWGTTNAYNQIGLHARGSGDVMWNPNYYDRSVEAPKDSSELFAVAVQIFDGELVPPTYTPYASSNYGDAILADIQEHNAELIAHMNNHLNPPIQVPDFEGMTNSEKRDAARAYGDSLEMYANLVEAKWEEIKQEWYAYVYPTQVKPQLQECVDSLLDVESALETPFEGFRFGALARADYRAAGVKVNPVTHIPYAQGEYFAAKVGKRDSGLKATLTSRRKWFIKWKDLIGTN